MSKLTSSTAIFRLPVVSARLFAIVICLAAISAVPDAARAGQLLFWGNGATQGTAGTWSAANRWGTSAGGPFDQTWNNANNDAADFGGTVGTVTLTSAQTVDSIHFDNPLGVYTFSGASGSIQLTSGVISTDVATTNTGAQTFNVPITVPSTVGNVGNGTNGDLIINKDSTDVSNNCCTVALAAANTVNNLRITGTTTGGRMAVTLNNLQAIKNNSLADRATVYLERAGAAIQVNNTAFNGTTFYPDIILNAADSATAGFLNHIGIGANIELNYAGTISSGATGSNESNVRFAIGTSGGTGTLNLLNAASYNGTTTFVNGSATIAGVIRNSTGADDALPATTRLIYGAGNVAAVGAYDLNGRSQTITGISTVAGTTGNIGGVINTSANQGTLKINATATQDEYTGNIGIAPSQTILHEGSTYTQSDNIAVEMLASSDPSAVVTFAKADGMTYSGGTTINGGILAVTNTSGSGTGSGDVTINGGALGGTGSVSGNVVLNGGAIAPGLSPGILTVGSASFGAASALNVELAGLTPDTEYDQLAVAGAAALDGTLDISLLGGFTPQYGDSFTILTSGGGVSGTFAGLSSPDLGNNKNWRVIYSSGSVVLTVVPEPTSFALLGLAIMGLIGAMRRR